MVVLLFKEYYKIPGYCTEKHQTFDNTRDALNDCSQNVDCKAVEVMTENWEGIKASACKSLQYISFYNGRSSLLMKRKN